MCVMNIFPYEAWCFSKESYNPLFIESLITNHFLNPLMQAGLSIF